MNIIDFFNKYNGRAIDRDGYYGAQCMDLYNQYQEEVMGIKPKGAVYAKDVWNTYNKDDFTQISNTYDFVPKLGDVAVWGYASSNPYGHVAICTGKGDINTFESFDQNWSAQVCKYENHNYFGGFLGVLRPKKGDISYNTKFKVRVDKAEANVRKEPNTTSAIVPQPGGFDCLKKGDIFVAVGTVNGENVEGNTTWYKSAKGNYVWSGGLTKL